MESEGKELENHVEASEYCSLRGAGEAPGCGEDPELSMEIEFGDFGCLGGHT